MSDTSARSGRGSPPSLDRRPDVLRDTIALIARIDGWWEQVGRLRTLLNSDSVYRSARRASHVARVFVAAVFLATTLQHVGDWARVASLVAGAAVFIVGPAALEAVRPHG